jgi:hypothetical protein
MQKSARKADTPTAGMHAGRRFGDVLVGMQADEELAWFFNVAGTQMVQPSILASAFTGRSPGSVEVFEARVEALHAARKIWRRLENIGAREARVLETVYSERAWPGTLVRRFGPLAGVVEGLVGVRAEYLHARMSDRTAATSTAAWLEELVGRCSKELFVWRKQGVRAREQAVKAYERARGKGPSVVPPEDRG